MILLGLGSNLGDRQANLEQALALLGGDADAPLRLQRVSAVYESAALLPENAPEDWDIPYYNIVVAAESSLEPEALLTTVKAIEKQMGRKDIGRWGPRLIDIDILAHGTRQIQSDELNLPHAGMLERDFVMLPLAEILPHWHYPHASAQEPVTAQEIAHRKAMTIGKGLRRLSIALRWTVK